jgi:hypothetical protein
MRIAPVLTGLCMLFLVQPVFAQEWVEYANRVDRFTVPAPGEPAVDTITWDSEYGARFPGRVYRWQQGRSRYSLTVVDYSDSERIHSQVKHIAYSGGPGPGGVYWLVDIMGSVAHAAARYRQKPGVKVTYDAFHYIEFVTGIELQLTNPDESRTYAGMYLHDNRLYILDATAARGEAPPIIFQQSFGFLDPDGKPVRYRPFYVNPLPAPRLGQPGGAPQGQPQQQAPGR